MDYIEDAVQKFRELLEEQKKRAEDVEKNAGAIDFSRVEKLRIGIIPGDGIGPVITREAKKILAELLKKDIEAGKIELVDIEGLTIENRKKAGKPIPDEIMDVIYTCPILLKGPTETPKGGTLGSANVEMRKKLDLYSNIRPVRVPELGIDWTFFRENTEGEYVLGNRGVEIPDVLACDFKITTDAGTRRIARAGFAYARANRKNYVSIVTKANILKKTDGKFSKICHEVAADYPEITAEDWYIDIMSANLVNERVRSKFQVFILPNLYGDIITDEAAQIQGGVGTAGSANVGDRYAMFEAIHGSAPRMVADGVAEYANPSSMFKAAEMLLRHIGRTQEADKLCRAMDECAKEGKIVAGRGGSPAAEYSAYVLSKINA